MGEFFFPVDKYLFRVHNKDITVNSTNIVVLSSLLILDKYFSTRNKILNSFMTEDPII